MIVFANIMSAIFFVLLFLALRTSFLDFYFVIGIFVGVVVFWLISSLFGIFVYKKYFRSPDLRYVVIPVSLVFGLCVREISLRVGSAGVLIIIVVGLFFGFLCLLFCQRIVNDQLKNLAVSASEARQPRSGDVPR